MTNDFLSKLFSLEGKTALVTGAAGGIGSAIAKGLAQSGANVALCDINMKALVALQKGIGPKAHIFEMDMANINTFGIITAMVAKTSGSIDILVNCAGINKREGFVDVDEATYDAIMNINLKGAFFLSQTVAPFMKKQNSGSIINIGSHNTGAILGGVSVYGASKSGLMSLTRSMAIEWAKYNIRANCISPGHIKTDLTTPTWEHPQRSSYLLERIALGRPGSPEDIVGLTILLASDAASYVTGEEFRVDGGCLAGGQPWEYDTKF